MPATVEDYQKLAAQSQGYQDEANQFSTGATTLSSQVMEAVRADRVQRGVSQLSTDVGTTLGQIPTDTAGIRERTGAMVSPFQQDVLTSAQRGQNLNTLGTAATEAEYTKGTLTDILTEQSNKLKAIAATKLAEAQKAQNEADNTMKMLEYQESVRQFNETLAFNKSKSTGGGSFVGSIDEILKALNGNQGATSYEWVATSSGSTPTEAKPAYTPASGDGAKSKQGQWTFKANTPEKTGDETKVAFQAMMIKDLVETGGKNISDINTIYNMSKPSATELAKTQSDSDLKNIIDTVDSLKTQPSGLLNIVTWRSKLNIATQRLAKWIEKSRLSDADRAFYLSQMPSTVEIMTLPDVATAKIDGVVSGITGKITISDYE